MKIVFSDDIFLLQRYGGISRYFSEIASILAERSSCDVSISGMFFVNEYLKDSPLPLRKGINLQTNSYIGRALLLCSKWVSFVQNIINKPDVIHYTYYSNNIKKIKGAKIIITVFDMIHEIFPEQFSGLDNTSSNKRISVSMADHIICISQQTKKDLIKFFEIEEKKISVTMLGATLPVFRGAPFANKKPYILYVGSRNGYKNFVSLLKAYSFNSYLLEKYDLISFGGGPFSARERLMINDFGVTDKVIYVSGNDDILASLYKGADLFVYPSLYEGFGIPPLEAMSLGCPVACSDKSSIPEVVGDAAAKFDPESFKSIEHTILKVLNDASYKSDLIEKGYERVKLFGWNKCAEETLNIYQKVLN